MLSVNRLTHFPYVVTVGQLDQPTAIPGDAVRESLRSRLGNRASAVSTCRTQRRESSGSRRFWSAAARVESAADRSRRFLYMHSVCILQM